MAGVAGNLAAFEFTGLDGVLVAGRDAGGAGSRCGYTAAPTECVNYVAAHDNETLYDLVALKLNGSTEQRVAVLRLAHALVAWSQGIPFFHAGDELCRSKSLDRDSYKSGDWFNAIDWTGRCECESEYDFGHTSPFNVLPRRTGWGVGLPPAAKNKDWWPVMKPLLVQPGPTQAQALESAGWLRKLLAVRASSPLFRLRTLEDVQARLVFHNCGVDALPAVLVWSLLDDVPFAVCLDARFSRILLAINAQQESVELRDNAWSSITWMTHPELDTPPGASCAYGRLCLPPLTATAWVAVR